ncbi:MAG: YbbR-like domain-containing protein [Bacteroidota bacterium]|nr:YbbR-like domain-containing protein [Bacteroidota bacterium]
MTENIEDNIKNFFARRNFKSDKRLFVFLIFVFIATIFWFLNQLEQEYETEVTLPIRYVNFPKDKILVNEMPKYFDIKVKAYGYKLLEYKISNKFLPFVIDVNTLNMRLYSQQDYVKFYSLTKDLSDKIEQQISSELQIITIQPDTLFFDFASRVSKKVPVESKVNPIPASQYMIKGNILIQPDSVTISGANPIIDTINKIYTQNVEITDLTKNYKQYIALDRYDNVDYSDEKVEISITVEKYTEGSLKIPLKVKNVPDSLVLRTFPNEISVSYLVALSDYDKVLPQFFDADVDYNDINVNQNKVKVRITNSPDYIRSLRFYPQAVEYLIERKND